mmetsp:Transcript_15787/g.27645  ORF Transcript_15787/g.27645 Transcript_15787/m.27645 type:complete len:227 (-) Transcript_15787:175-855(-)|eukprot:CAMPEP_0197654352 /NCGR_PEP_ID=MMETSP1338-20131121/38804_1 /TAXON_ID=43686 ORGANISM="Pelagodinium beii, Strain RCC1491" /NCGR_SAMPLE_ID=MMETSP1338 /ASSEMBLY_ACC=CAM_ASM_000754 /LENGTH=226 /DNA_ID=CAMNT_0043229789 /DNA_START=52 /DNA_END=732 /DNA_ORIENTATION=+
MSLKLLAWAAPLVTCVASFWCPEVEPVEDFNITEYVRASWFVQQQQVTSYQSEDQLECVVATYDLSQSNFFQEPPFFSGQFLSVYNYYAGGRPTLEEGEPVNRLCGSVLHPDEPSELVVAPCFLAPNLFGSPYWIIALGKSGAEYDWAIVSGGRPTVKYDDGCTTRSGYYFSGLWILSRKPLLPESELAEARATLTSMGYTLSQLKSVNQTGCSYGGAYLKPVPLA